MVEFGQKHQATGSGRYTPVMYLILHTLVFGGAAGLYFSGTLDFIEPNWLWLVATCPVLCWMSHRSLSGLGRFRHAAALTLRFLIVCAIAIALAEPQYIEDPDDLTEFYLLYGRAEQSRSAVMRNRRVSFLGGLAGILIGIGFAAASRALPRKLVVAPLLVGIALVFAPLVVGQPGLLRWGAGAALAGAALVWMFGRRA